MLTIFTIPKPFRGHIATIQRNAARSWALLRPQPEIIIFGDEEGTAEIARDLGLRHVPDVACNEYGTPLLSDVFSKAQGMASNELLCYVNADIILMGDFASAVQRIPFSPFLMAGQRWDIDIEQDWDYSPGWENRLREYVEQRGRLHPPQAIDYFAFPRNLELELPPFAVGRIGWDNWLIAHMRKRRIAVVDATEMIMAVHQNHDYSHIPVGTSGVKKGQEAWERGPEARRNIEITGHREFLEGDPTEKHTLEDANWRLTASGEVRPLSSRRELIRNLKRLLPPAIRTPLRSIKHALFPPRRE